MIIKSILDNDLYKFSQGLAVAKLYPRQKVRYEFFNRGGTYIPSDVADKLQGEINELSDLQLTNDERKFLETKCYFLDPVFLDFLKGYTYDPSEVKIFWEDGNLRIVIEGYWYRTIFWEVPLMALVSELFFGGVFINRDVVVDSVPLAKKKAKRFEKLGVKFADFGTRRRFSERNHDFVVSSLVNMAPSSFVGTSNLHFAHKYNVKPIGTQAHEWFMFHAAKYGFHRANSISLGRWVDVYNGQLGIALTDTFTTDNFFKSFDTMYAKLFDGVRHDSGDPIGFGDKTVAHYEKLGIDPTTKTIVFSDGLNPTEVERIFNHFNGRIRISFGIGTNLTNDIPGIKPLNMVIKMTAMENEEGDWIPTIKLSDTEGKHTGDKETIELAKRVLKV